MAASPDMAGDAGLQATAGMAVSPDMVEDTTEPHQRSKRRARQEAGFLVQNLSSNFELNDWQDLDI